MYDIAIVGLGPAGATLARLLDSRFSVVALDLKRADGQGFHKPCGGLLAPDAQKALARFNLTLPKEVLVDPQIFTVRTIDTASESGWREEVVDLAIGGDKSGMTGSHGGGDLRLVEDFVRVLQGANHERIAYPEDPKK